MLQITNKIDKIKKKLKAPLKTFVNSTNIDEIVRKVPADLYFNGGLKASKFLRSTINSIDMRQTTQNMNAIEEICTEFEFKPSYKKHRAFLKWFIKWDLNPVDQFHVQRVRGDIRKMAAEYENLLEKFNNELTAVHIARVDLDKFITLACSSLNILLQTTYPAQKTEIIIDVEPMLNKIHKQQSQFSKNLSELKTVLKNYNQQRMIWAESLIGMRESIEPSPKEIPTRGVFAIISRFCGGRKD